MLKYQDHDLLKWYLLMGVVETISNQPRDYLGEQQVNQHLGQELQPMHITQNESGPLYSLNDIIAQARAAADQCTTLAELKEAVMNFEGCAIKKTANKTVFSDGNPESEIMIIGEAPGANEDLAGIPFCGDTGKLLDNMLRTIGINRSNGYITNVLFWRPPGNRKPTAEEVNICSSFVEKHIALMKPKLLILVGSSATSALLKSTEPISKLRTTIHQYNNQYLVEEIPVVILFHPSYLLRQPSQKKLAWQDLLKIKHLIDENQINLPSN